MAVARIFSLRQVYTKTNTVKIMLGEGEHEVVSNNRRLVVTCSNVTFAGRGASRTTVRGGFGIFNRMNVFFEHLNVTNPQGSGFWMDGGETNVEVLDCIIQNCTRNGMRVYGGATVVATRCDFMENGYCGVAARGSKYKSKIE